MATRYPDAVEITSAENERVMREWERFPAWEDMTPDQKTQAERLAERQGLRLVKALDTIGYHLEHRHGI